ncbi:GNAT family N-acetyltransferase [Halobacillus massiliensis]|uniref:GNAT family N-acetyltransferase n=1 Tax=Halobacillus massiliensis TaxID=1926286 RepID=UPI001FE9B1C3|nr:GNAT family protein [Halobacillus massiliensis]
MANVLENLPVLETERLILRKISKSDVNDMYAYGSNPLVSEYVTWETHTCQEDTEGFIDLILEGYLNKEKALWAMELKANGKMAGTIDFVSIDKKHRSGELGYVLSDKFWGQGLTTEASRKVIEFGITELGLERIQARCLAENIGSQRVMEKAGMTFEGTLRKGFFAKGKFHDLKVYSILREELQG